MAKNEEGLPEGLERREGSPFIQYRFKIGGRRFRGSTETTSVRDAKRVLADKREEAAEEVKKAKLCCGPPMTWGDASRAYFDEKGQHLKGKGARKMAWALNWITLALGGGRPVMSEAERELARRAGAAFRLDKITGAIVQQLQGRRRGEPKQRSGAGQLAHATVNRTVIEPLRQVLLHAKLVHGAQIEALEWDRFLLKESAERKRYLKPEEELRLFRAAREDYAPIIRFALLTGCREAECVGLTWDDVDFGAKELVIRGKGDTVEAIEMAPQVRDLLWSLRGNHPEKVFTFVQQGGWYGRQVGEHQPITINGLLSYWRKLKAACGLRDFRFHDLRHTAATRMLRAPGVNIKTVKQALRHKRIETTMRYAHVQEGDVARAMQAAAEAAAQAQVQVAAEEATQLQKGATMGATLRSAQ